MQIWEIDLTFVQETVSRRKVQSQNIRQNLNTLHKFVLNLARINICVELFVLISGHKK